MKTLKEKYKAKKLIKENKNISTEVQNGIQQLIKAVGALKQVFRDGETLSTINQIESEINSVQSKMSIPSVVGDTLSSVVNKGGGWVLGLLVGAGSLDFNWLSLSVDPGGVLFGMLTKLLFVGGGTLAAIKGAQKYFNRNPLAKPLVFLQGMKYLFTQIELTINKVTPGSDDKTIGDLFEKLGNKERLGFLKNFSEDKGFGYKGLTSDKVFNDIMKIPIKSRRNLTNSLNDLTSFFDSIVSDLEKMRSDIENLKDKKHENEDKNENKKPKPENASITNAGDLIKYLTDGNKKDLSVSLKEFSISDKDKFIEFSNFMFNEALVGS